MVKIVKIMLYIYFTTHTKTLLGTQCDGKKHQLGVRETGFETQLCHFVAVIL